MSITKAFYSNIYHVSVKIDKFYEKRPQLRELSFPHALMALFKIYIKKAQRDLIICMHRDFIDWQIDFICDIVCTRMWEFYFFFIHKCPESCLQNAIKCHRNLEHGSTIFEGFLFFWAKLSLKLLIEYKMHFPKINHSIKFIRSYPIMQL